MLILPNDSSRLSVGCAASVPFISCKSYELPAFVGKNSLVIASSFSGNTEETLASFGQALKTGAKIVCLTSWGKLLTNAQKHQLDVVQIPAVKQPPRSCLGYSFVQVLYILKHFGFTNSKLYQEWRMIVGFHLVIEKKKIQIREFRGQDLVHYI